MIDHWDTLSAKQRMALLDLMQATFQVELQPSIDETNAVFAAHGIPAKLDIEVRLVIDPNRDPRLE